MKSFELFNQNGRRHFRLILHEIYPDSCIDESNGVGTIYNENGLTWIREYCEAALPSIKGMSLKCEFLDDERTSLYGHGVTNVKGSLPTFEDATMVGYFERGYIEDIETEEGKKTVCIGEGIIDGLCYSNFTEKLDQDIKDGNAPFGSVEILKTGDNPSIIYKYGYKDFGRIPMVYEYSGYALLGVRPADQTAKILELNNSNKEDSTMNENEVRAIVTQTITELNSSAEEIAKIKAQCENELSELNTIIAENERCKEELNARISELESQIAALNEANEKLTADKETAINEVNQLKQQLETAQGEKKVTELNAAISRFTDEQKDYAKDEIEAFKANPLTSEINSVVQVIEAGIGRNYLDQVKALSEQDDNTVDDIFVEINQKSDSENDDVDIF